MRYWPSLFSLVARSRALLSSRADTVALVTKPPLESLTVTCRSPVAAPCAKPNVVSRVDWTATMTSFRNIIESSPFGHGSLPQSNDGPSLAGVIQHVGGQIRVGLYIRKAAEIKLDY